MKYVYWILSLCLAGGHSAFKVVMKHKMCHKMLLSSIGRSTSQTATNIVVIVPSNLLYQGTMYQDHIINTSIVILITVVSSLLFYHKMFWYGMLYQISSVTFTTYSSFPTLYPVNLSFHLSQVKPQFLPLISFVSCNWRPTSFYSKSY